MIRYILKCSKILNKLYYFFLVIRWSHLIHISNRNSLRVCSSEQVFNKLQRLQNNVARIVTNSTRHAHGQDLLESLHWLPVRERGIFKMTTMIYTASSCSELSYLAELISIHTPAHSLRSLDDSLKLVEPRVHNSLARRRFRCASPKIWNWLPLSVRQKTSPPNFKAALKTFLFANIGKFKL